MLMDKLKDIAFLVILIVFIILLGTICDKFFKIETTNNIIKPNIEVDSIVAKKDSLVIEINNLDSIKNAKIIEVRSLDNDSTLKLFYKLVKE